MIKKEKIKKIKIRIHNIAKYNVINVAYTKIRAYINSRKYQSNVAAYFQI